MSIREQERRQRAAENRMDTAMREADKHVRGRIEARQEGRP